jgi:ribosome-binding factor A
MKIKTERTNNVLQREISYILMTEVKDSDLKFLTITDVKTTNDYSFSKVYVRLLDESKKEEVMKSLKNASGFIRKQLFNRVDMRHVPSLEFIYDESVDYGKKIENIIETLSKD